MLNYRLCQVATTGKRWYVEYYIYDPVKCRLVRKREYVNRAKDPEERKRKLYARKQEIDDQLMNGHTLAGASELNYSEQTIGDAILLHVEDKKLRQRHRSFGHSKSLLLIFHRWLIGKGLHLLMPGQIKAFHIATFLNSRLKKGNSKRTYNNYMGEISAMFNRFEIEERIIKSPCKALQKLKSQSEKNISYTDAQVVYISNWLNEYEPYTHLFCKFIVYCFLRESEIRRLQVHHFDLAKMIIKLPASIEKTEVPKVKKIPAIFQAAIKKLQLHKCPGNWYIFTKEGTPGPVPIGECYFTRRFRKVKKKMELSSKHTMYGLRHTYVSHLLRNGTPWSDIMAQTGHTTFAAFEKYARTILAESPKDLSAQYSMLF